MSVTTSPTPVPTREAPPHEAPPVKPGFFSGRLRRAQPDETPHELLEFYSPSSALASVPAKRVARNTALLCGTLVGSIFIIFAVMTTDRIAQGQGKIVSMTPEVVVQPLNTSIVKTIAVSVGDIVHKGQLLAQLDPTLTTADNTAALDQVDRYQTEIDRLTAENRQVAYKPRNLTPGALVQEGIFAQRASAREAELRYYQGQISAQMALQAQADANIRQYAKETGVAVDVEKIRVQLEHDQVGSRLDTLAAVNARLEAERQVLGNVQQAESSRQNALALKGQLDNYNQQWFADISQTVTSDNVQLATYRDQLEHSALSSKLIDLRAEQDATVLSVAAVSVGAVLQGGQTFFTLVPLNAPLEIDAQLTADQAGFLAVGQAAQINFAAFPSSLYGSGSGTVRLISPDSYLTGTGATAATATSAGTTSNAVFTGQTPNSPYFYDVRVSLDRLSLRHVGNDVHIIPGMPVEADIKVGQHTIWEYLVERLMPVITDAMREPA